jgi:GxxExxY protein
MRENEISYDIRGAVYKVYNNLGPGLLESIYEHALAYELINSGHDVKNQVGIKVKYLDNPLELGFRLDILVDDCVIIEVKSVDQLADIHHKQLLSYLKLTDKRLGILVNFNTVEIDKSIIRIVNNL